MRTASQKLLVIDDTEANRYATSHILKRAGYRMYEASTAAEGAAAIQALHPDLVLLDVKLPDKNGFALCSEIKADPALRHIPILMTSASFTEGRDKAYGLDSGADGYITTPVDALELVATVRALLRIREAERNFKETDERLRLMIESVQDYAIYSLDESGVINSWNAASARVFGYEDNEVIGRDGSILYTLEDRTKDSFRRELTLAAQEGKSVNEQWRVHKDGSLFFTTGTTSPLLSPSGQIIGFTKVERDITEQLEIQERLRKSQEIFRTLADCIPALVWMADTRKACYYFNKSWLDFTGRTLEQEYGHGWTENIHPDDFPRCIDMYTVSYDLRQSFEMRYRLRRRDGEYRWMLDRGAPHYNLDGSFAGFTGACIDVHDEFLAEARLKASNERFDLAMQGMNDGLWDYNLLTDELYLSPRYKSMLGYEDDEFPNDIQEAYARIHPDDVEAARQNVRNTIAENLDDYRNVFRMQHKDGNYRWVLSRGMMIQDDNNSPIRMIGAHTDITEQKELEQELRAAHDRAEAANIAKTNFLANMSHEIRTPMNAIIGLANILSISPLDTKQKQMVTTLHSSAESLLTLLNDLLDITKIEENMVTLEDVAFDLRELIQKVVSLLAVKAEEKHLSLIIDYPDAMPGRFIGDPLRIQQVLTNLVSNALKFTSSGEVKVSVQSQPKDATAGKEAVTITISDTGIGIPPDKIDTIFEKFTQADNSTSRKYGGSGLGLAISRALITRMGGTLNASSTMGIGSTFMITLPLSLADARAALVADASEQAGAGDNALKTSSRVLLVEDYAPNILVASIVLESLGYSYDTAINGHEALDKFKRESFYAILMDIQMPGMDGFETTRQIRLWEREHQLPPTTIIAMTAHALVGDREKCLEAGMDDYISKPFTQEQLKSRLGAVHA